MTHGRVVAEFLRQDRRLIALGKQRTMMKMAFFDEKTAKKLPTLTPLVF